MTVKDDDRGTRRPGERDSAGLSVLWRRLDLPGHEFCRLSFRAEGPLLTGNAVFVDGRLPVRLAYRVTCDSEWRTISARIEGDCGNRAARCVIAVDEARAWRVNGREHPELAGLADLDLSFSPCTNLLPIRRLNLAIGESAAVTSARLRLPDCVVEPLDQIYRRTGVSRYWYEVAAFEYSAELDLTATGFVRSYPGLWSLEAER